MKYFTADHFCQSGFEDSSAYDKQTDHHDDNGIGETGKRFLRCEDIKHH